ncbi:MAG: YeeE/YedE thiosulfate transporter family protein [Panacibacter sp.]
MQSITNYLSQPWPWYIAGPLIGVVIILLQWLDNKPLAASSSYRHVCAATFPAAVPFLKYNWKAEAWNLFFVAGIFIGGFVAGNILSPRGTIAISHETTRQLQSIGVQDTSGFAPAQLFSFAALQTIPGIIIMVFGGFLIGFGSRYAGGCVSGHSMTGISNLQWTSMLATTCIFAGGVFTAYFLLPIILKL